LKKGGIILLEPGVFQFEKTVFLPSNIRLIGSGRDLTQIVLTRNSSCHIFTNADHIKGNSSIEISRLSLNGNMEYQPKPKNLKGITFSCGFYFKNVKNVVITDLSISNIRQTGLHFNGSENIKIREYVCDTAGWSGVSTTRTDAIDIEAYISNAGLDVQHSGVHLDGGKYARFTGSVTRTTGNGIMLDSRNAHFSHAVINAHVSNCKRGVSLSGYHKHELHTIYITGSFSDNHIAGVMVSNGCNVIIRDSSFIRNAEQGLLFQGRNGGRDCIVTDCYFDSNGHDISEIHASTNIQYFNNRNGITGHAPTIRTKKNTIPKSK